MKTLWGFLAIVSPLIVVPAMAADLGVRAPIMKAPPPAPVYNWSGCYIGGGGGYGMFDQEHDVFDQFGPIAPKIDTAGRGWFGTVSGGCDVQFGSFLPNFLAGTMLLGVFGDGNWGNIKGTSVLPIGSLGPPFVDEFGEQKLDESWSVGGRLGWLPTDRFLTFVSGGYTNAHLKDINYETLGGIIFDTLPAHRQGGWFVGTGYEYNLGWFGFSGLTWKTEYRWNDYGSRTDQLLLVPSGLPSFQSNSHLYVQTVTSQLIWRFNWGGPGTY